VYSLSLLYKKIYVKYRSIFWKPKICSGDVSGDVRYSLFFPNIPLLESGDFLAAWIFTGIAAKNSSVFCPKRVFAEKKFLPLSAATFAPCGVLLACPGLCPPFPKSA
jgi:hypothetical protein